MGSGKDREVFLGLLSCCFVGSIMLHDCVGASPVLYTYCDLDRGGEQRRLHRRSHQPLLTPGAAFASSTCHIPSVRAVEAMFGYHKGCGPCDGERELARPASRASQSPRLVPFQPATAQPHGYCAFKPPAPHHEPSGGHSFSLKCGGIKCAVHI